MKRLLPKSLKNPRGFTLIELLVVISIIAILSIIGVVIYSNAQKSGRDARRKGDIDAIANALEQDFTTGNKTQYGPATNAMFASGIIPEDPTSNHYYWNNGQAQNNGLPAATFVICAKLENGGGNANDATGNNPAQNGNFYCRKSSQ